MRKKWFAVASAALLVFAVAACESFQDIGDLEVINQNEPDRARALKLAGDVEALIGSAFNVWWNGSQANSSPTWMLSTTADEGSMSWGNFGMRQSSSEPRVAWPNTSSYRFSFTTETGWFGSYEALSGVYDGLQSLDDPDVAAELDVNRATAWGKFVQGLSHSWIALMYDSGFIFDETVDLFEADGVTPVELELKPYPNLMTAAIAEFDEAISIASSNTFTTGSPWLNGTVLTSGELARVISSFQARYMSQVARTPAERVYTPAYWAKIVSLVDAGITADFEVKGDGAEIWWHSLYWRGNQPSPNRTWGRADYKTIGYTDQSGEYAGWLATAVADRNYIEITTDDRRLTGSAGPTDDGTDFDYQGTTNFRAARGTYHRSFYGQQRYVTWPESDGTIDFKMISFDAQQLLKAEGLIRAGGAANLDAATIIINNTRVGRGIDLTPALAGDADLMDKMIYEKRIENFLVCSGCAFFDRRGWGPLVDTRGSPPGTHHQGLVEGTKLHYAPPGAELETLEKPIYSYGGVGFEGSTLAPAASAPALYAGDGARRGVAATHVYAFYGLDLDSPAEKLAYLRNKWRSELSDGVSSLTHYQ